MADHPSTTQKKDEEIPVRLSIAIGGLLLRVLRRLHVERLVRPSRTRRPTPIEDGFQFDVSLLCDICSGIDWKTIMKATLSKRALEAFSTRHMYRLDGIDRMGAPFLRASVPSIARIAQENPSCPMCRLWLRAYRRVYPDIEPADDRKRHKTSWFTYYVNDHRYFDTWGGHPRGIDDDVQAGEISRKAMASFRMRFRGQLFSRGFEEMLELTCLDEQLPPESRSRGGRLLSDEAARPEVFKDWLALCRSEHGEKCETTLQGDSTGEAGRSLKFRLIDVDSLKVVVGSFDVPYCALSYVWGSLETFKATAGFFMQDPDRPGELLLDLAPFIPSTSEERGGRTIPNTILDAIKVTKRLGVRYLWVDSLCIIQDDDQDRDTAISNMDIVYKKAIITIVGASGSCCYAGLPRSHPGAPPITQITGDVGGYTFMLAQPSLDLVLEKTAWVTRGWTFQEAKLSSRLLIFTDHGVYFRCKGDTWAEDSIELLQTQTKHGRGPIYYKPNTSADPTPEEQFADYTYDVRLYTKRTLGVQNDIIKAFSGYMSELSRSRVVSTFVWGLPQSYLDAALLWKAVDLWEFQHWAYRDPGSKEDVRKRTPVLERGQDWDEIHQSALRHAASGFTYGMEWNFSGLDRRPGFPSWSWCGWEGQTGYFPRTATQPDIHLLRSIESMVEWPWAEGTNDNDDDDDDKAWKKAVDDGILTLIAWCAMIDFDELPFGLVAEESRTAWPGWPMDIGDFLRSGMALGVLLSRQLRHPVCHQGWMFESYRTLDPLEIDDVALVNVMVIDGDLEGVARRRGIGMMREDIWWAFEPKKLSIRLG